MKFEPGTMCDGTDCANVAVGGSDECYQVPAWRHPSGGVDVFVPAARTHYCAEHEAAAKAVRLEVRTG